MSQTPRHNWDNERKALLRDRIIASASQERKRVKKRRNRLFYYAAAALVPLIIAVGFLVKRPVDPTLEEFVRDMPNMDSMDADKVTVIFGEGEQVAIDEDEGRVEYSKTGSKVQLGSDKNIEQQAMKDNKPVFNTVLVPYGKRSYLKLSDGTKVWINSGSKLVFPTVFSGTKREVFLEGEAIFEVAHNQQKPFTVHSSTQDIEVLGTIFNVSHYSEETLMQTVLKSGSIRITHQKDEKNSLIMEPGTLQSFDKTSNRISTQKVNADDYFSWRNGFLTLSNHSLSEITARLARYYNRPIDIKNDELSSMTFSGRLDLSEDLDRVLKTLQKITYFQILDENGKIVLTQ